MTSVFVKLPHEDVDGCGRCKRFNLYDKCFFAQINPADGEFPRGAPFCTVTIPTVQCALYRGLDR